MGRTWGPSSEEEGRSGYELNPGRTLITLHNRGLKLDCVQSVNWEKLLISVRAHAWRRHSLRVNR